MPAISVEYEYRVHDGTTAITTFFAGSGGALLVASSVAGGTNPWLTEPPAGDGTTIDPLTGKTRAGAWSVAIGDPITSGTDRLVTAVLEDATRGWRSRLTSRRAFVRERENGGAWVTTWVGFVSRVRYTSAAQVQITHTDSPARDKDAAAATQRPTETVSAYVTRWPTRACLAGGPIRGGWLFRQDPGGWDCVVESQSGGFTVFRVTGAYSAPSFQRRTVNLWAPIQTLNDAARPYFVGSALLGGSFPRLTVETFTPGVASTFSDPVVLASPIYVPTLPNGPGPVLGPTPQYHEPTLFCSQERITVAGTVGTVGQVRRLRVLALDPSDAFPVYTTAHPVTLVETLMVEQGLTVDTTSRDSVRELVGTAARVSVRIAAVRNFWRLAEEILAPYGVALRATAGGAVGFVAIRRTTSSLPTTTIALDDLAETDGAGIYEVAEQSVVARVAFSSVLYGLASPSDESGPADGIVAQPIRVEREAWDLGTEEAPRTLTLDADAMFHVDGQLESDAPRLGTAIAQEAFLRSRGGTVEIGELLVRRGTAAAALRVGDECLVNLPHLPHRNKRLGDDGTVPARVATVVRAQVEPMGVRLQLADAGSAAIDTGTAPTASVAQDGSFPRQCVALTITNAATLNAAGRGVRVQVAVTSGAAPASTAYTDLVAYAPGAVPTAAERLGPFTPGQTVYLRLRAEQPGIRPGAWQTAISAALATLPAPSGVTVTWGTGGRTVGDLAWTNGDAAALVVVAIRRTADAAPGRTIDVLPAGSTRLRVWREVDADVFAAYGTSYTVEVSHLDPLTGQPSARATATVTPSDTMVVPAFPAPRLEIISPNGDPTAGTPNGIELAIATGATGEPMTAWRGATSLRANAVRIAVLDPDATTFRDYLPADNVMRHYWVEYLRAELASGTGYAGSAVPGPLRDQAGTADSPRPTVSVVGGQLYRQTSTSFSATLGGSIGGTGTTGRLARWATASTLGDSVLEDDGTHAFPTADATRDLGTVARRWRDVRASRDVYVAGLLRLDGTNVSFGGLLGLGWNATDLSIGGVSAGSFTRLRFFTDNVERMRVHASGGISLGDATDPGAGVVRVAGRLLVNSATTYQLGVGAASATDADIFIAGMTGVTNGLTYRRIGGAFEFRVTDGDTVLGNLRFLAHATHDIGTSSVRPRDGWFSRDLTVGGVISGNGSGLTNISFGALTTGGGVNRDVLQISGGAPTWAAPPLFSSTERGAVGPSGGGTTNFLRADGTWAAPSVSSVSASSVTAGTFGGASYIFSNAVRFDSGLRLVDNDYIYRWDGSSAINGIRYNTSIARWESAARWSAASLGTGTADSTTFLRGDGTWATPASATWTYASKASDETKTSDTALTTTGLSFSISANQAMRVRGVLHWRSVNGTGDIQLDVTGPASPTLVRINLRTMVGATGGSARATAFSSAMAITGTAEEGYASFDMLIVNGSNAGTITLRWAQNTSSTDSTTLYAGSWMEWTSAT